MTIETINLILQIIIAAGIISLFFYFKNALSAQKTTIEAMKDHLGVIKDFKEIYKPQDFKDYVQMKEETANERTKKLLGEYEDKIKFLETKTTSQLEIVSQYRTALIRAISNLPNFLLNKEDILSSFNNSELKQEWEKLLSSSGLLFREDLNKELPYDVIISTLVHDFAHLWSNIPNKKNKK